MAGTQPQRGDRRRAGVVGRERERDGGELAQQVAHQVRLGVDRLLGVERVGEADRARAVPGMNCAMPCAPARLTANGLKLDSA